MKTASLFSASGYLNLLTLSVAEIGVRSILVLSFATLTLALDGPSPSLSGIGMVPLGPMCRMHNYFRFFSEHLLLWSLHFMLYF